MMLTLSIVHMTAGCQGPVGTWPGQNTVLLLIYTPAIQLATCDIHLLGTDSVQCCIKPLVFSASWGA
jgi:hypothetical protein